MVSKAKTAAKRAARREGRFWLGALAAILLWLLVAAV